MGVFGGRCDVREASSALSRDLRRMTRRNHRRSGGDSRRQFRDQSALLIAQFFRMIIPSLSMRSPAKSATS
jgi:hypothetical protein